MFNEFEDRVAIAMHSLGPTQARSLRLSRAQPPARIALASRSSSKPWRHTYASSLDNYIFLNDILAALLGQSVSTILPHLQPLRNLECLIFNLKKALESGPKRRDSKFHTLSGWRGGKIGENYYPGQKPATWIMHESRTLFRSLFTQYHEIGTVARLSCEFAHRCIKAQSSLI